ncbi:MAG TPA: hypothetical protein VFJ05_02950 [Nitrososphaeraceae archaeon]|nr:hypothetical protein [Nitrososphaeraceae archaeon]
MLGIVVESTMDPTIPLMLLGDEEEEEHPSIIVWYTRPHLGSNTFHSVL